MFLEMCSDEDFAADVEKLTLHEPVSSPSMASFESSYEKRQQLNGRRTSFGGGPGGAGGAHRPAAGRPPQQPQIAAKPPRLRNIATRGSDGGGGGGGRGFSADLETAPREDSLEWKSSREVLGGWGAPLDS
jgi:hypothetical protein